MYSTYLLFLLAATSSNTVLVVALLRHSQKNSTIISLIILLIQVNIWFVPKLLTNASHAHGMLFETLSRISALGYIFVPVTFLFFSLSYVMYYTVFRNVYFWFFLFVIPIIFLYLSWTSDLVGVHDAGTATLYPWGYETPTGPLWPLYMLWYDSIMLIATGILIYNYRTLVDEIKKRQALYLILAVVVPLIVATITTGILPIFNIFVFPVGLILAFMMTIIGVFVVYRYDWFVVTPFAILSSISHSIITVDNNGNVIQMNPYSEKVLRVRLPHVMGKPLEKILLVKRKKTARANLFRNLLRPVLRQGKSMPLDTYAILNQNYQVFAATGSITPIYSERKGIIGANVFLRDATADKEREKRKDDYFSMMSHELKTPITSIKAYSQLLLTRMSTDHEKNREIVKKISSHSDSLTRRVNDFLELSRLTSGKFTLQREYFQIDDFVLNTVETLRIAFKHRTISIHGKTDCVIFADKDRFEQVLINLLTNAMKFSEEHSEIMVILHADSKQSIVGVRDFGRGINPKYHKKIFSRFFQIGSAQEKGKGGLGIGLFLATLIMQAHSGKIWVESKPAQGSTFYISFPHHH